MPAEYTAQHRFYVKPEADPTAPAGDRSARPTSVLRDFDVAVSIDVEALVRMMGQRAAENRSGTAKLLNGVVTVKVKRR